MTSPRRSAPAGCWWSSGPDWSRQLDGLLADRDGVAPATTMIRVPGINDAIVDRLLRPCEAILNKHGQSHRQQLALIHGKPRAAAAKIGRVAVVVDGWRLWRDDRALLAAAAAAASLDCVIVDASRPDASSVLSIARRADGCDAIVMANRGRGDLPMVVAPAVPWVTLLTRGRPPTPSPAGARDRLVLVDASQCGAALAAGWPADRIDVVGRADLQPPSNARLALAIDLRPIVKPAAIAEMSSHGLVWDRLIERLGHLDFVASAAPRATIEEIARTVGMPVAELPSDLLWERAALPAHAVAIGRRLARAGVDFDVFGIGWDAVPDVASRWRGPLADERAFDAMRASVSALFDVWPGTAAHASRWCGLPLIDTWARTDAQLARDAGTSALGTVAVFDLDAIVARL